MDKIKDQKIMYILKASSLKYLVCKTSIGDLELNINKDTNEYFFTLDSVILPKETNKLLVDLICK